MVTLSKVSTLKQVDNVKYLPFLLCFTGRIKKLAYRKFPFRVDSATRLRPTTPTCLLGRGERLLVSRRRRMFASQGRVCPVDKCSSLGRRAVMAGTAKFWPMACPVAPNHTHLPAVMLRIPATLTLAPLVAILAYDRRDGTHVAVDVGVEAPSRRRAAHTAVVRFCSCASRLALAFLMRTQVKWHVHTRRMASRLIVAS